MRNVNGKTLEEKLKMPGIGQKLTNGVIKARLSFLKKNLGRGKYDDKTEKRVRHYIYAYAFRLKHGSFSGNLWRKAQDKKSARRPKAKSRRKSK